jgi:hypothetical protein
MTPSSAATTRHDDVGDLRAARTHQRERFVARGVEEYDRAAVADVDVIGADVLRDAAGFALRNLRLANRVEQRRLAVVDVAHDRDDRRAAAHIFGTALVALGGDELLLEAAHLDLGAELARDLLGRLHVERAVDGHHHALHQQLGENVLHAHIELVGEVLHRHALGSVIVRVIGGGAAGACGICGARAVHGASAWAADRVDAAAGTVAAVARTATLPGLARACLDVLLRLLRTNRLRRKRPRTAKHAARCRTRRRIAGPLCRACRSRRAASRLAGRGRTRGGAGACAAAAAPCAAARPSVVSPAPVVAPAGRRVRILDAQAQRRRNESARLRGVCALRRRSSGERQFHSRRFADLAAAAGGSSTTRCGSRNGRGATGSGLAALVAPQRDASGAAVPRRPVPRSAARRARRSGRDGGQVRRPAPRGGAARSGGAAVAGCASSW